MVKAGWDSGTQDQRLKRGNLPESHRVAGSRTNTQIVNVHAGFVDSLTSNSLQRVARESERKYHKSITLEFRCQLIYT